MSRELYLENQSKRYLTAALEARYDSNEARQFACQFYHKLLDQQKQIKKVDCLASIALLEKDLLIDKLKSDLAEAQGAANTIKAQLMEAKEEIVILKQRDERTEKLVSLGIGALSDDLREAEQEIVRLKQNDKQYFSLWPEFCCAKDRIKELEAEGHEERECIVRQSKHIAQLEALVREHASIEVDELTY